MLLISSSVAVCFRTIPEVPSFMAWTNSFLSSDAVRTITRVLLSAACSRCSVAKPVQAGHLQIEQQDVRLVLLQHIQHLPAILGLRDYFEILFQGQQPAQTIAENRMVVRHYDADLGLRRLRPAGGSVRWQRCSQAYTMLLALIVEF